jgi:NADH:ubiquinone oxidoreductase subunit
MAILKKIFTWWEGATIGTALYSWRSGRKVGSDSLGNIYYEGKKDGRRWVIYSGENDASAVTPEWHAWLHGQIDGLPDDVLPPARPFQKSYTRNLTGTDKAYLPSGALERGGQRQASGGDYEAWTPN